MLKLTTILIMLISPLLNSEASTTADEDVCRVTCYIAVPTMGTFVVHQATAGGLFVSCATASSRACAAAQAKADAEF
jgi:hypothetical protein